MTQINAIRSVKVGNITLNLHNVGYLECLDRVSDETGEPEKTLWVYFVGGRNVLLYAGDPEICQGLYEYINAAMGQFLDLTYITKPRREQKGGEKPESA